MQGVSPKGSPKVKRLQTKDWQAENFVLELKDIDVDPLRYKTPSFSKQEWDNIPPIVPKFVLNLSKYLESLSAYQLSLSEGETVKQLREAILVMIEVSFIALQFRTQKQICKH